MSDKTIIRSRYTKRSKEDFDTEAGRPMHNNYQIKINEQGHKALFKIGEHNLQAEINAAADECDIKQMLERYKGGDIEALNKAKGGYVDLTQCPKDLREAQDSILKLKAEFAGLPVEVRRQFDHSPEKYIHEYGSKRWADILTPPKSVVTGKALEDPEKKKEEGEKVNE